MVLAGAARLRFQDETKVRVLGPGNYVDIAPHRRHRVEWTDPTVATVWLAFLCRRSASLRAGRKSMPAPGKLPCALSKTFLNQIFVNSSLLAKQSGTLSIAGNKGPLAGKRQGEGEGRLPRFLIRLQHTLRLRRRDGDRQLAIEGATEKAVGVRPAFKFPTSADMRIRYYG